MDPISISLLRWTWTWKNYVMEIFVYSKLSIYLKKTVKTAVKTLAFVWSNSLQLMRINEIRVLQSKGTINIQVFNIRASFLPVVIS